MHLAVIFSGADTILNPGGGALFILITRYLEICNKTLKSEKKNFRRGTTLKKRTTLYKKEQRSR